MKGPIETYSAAQRFGKITYSLSDPESDPACVHQVNAQADDVMLLAQSDDIMSNDIMRRFKRGNQGDMDIKTLKDQYSMAM
ncbi:hypothetical protein AJ79_00567 [Helicocarpus griseus UAMH5409]|uniref:Uncharacterized protein n=1 Tax=Helicocarpus griseus UAMH5409 TaxID=1447875 RepID=A0A2B7YBD5_9EURO|nr:hypothetical protein AJ79_00567 [Helicocarpus griseus UAMH5409]